MDEAALRAFAEGELDAWADSFANAGLNVRLPARGILQVSNGRPARTRLLLSVGVHGDETAPIEMLAALLQELAAAPRRLGVDLMVVVGNPDAIAAGARFVDADLNRMFRRERGELEAAAEARRADTIMRASGTFFAAGEGARWHLDLHTAIRASRYPTFAVVPEAIPEERRAQLLSWLEQAGIGAALLNPTSAGTFSAWSAQEHGATSATVELGRIGKLGSNDLEQFAATRAALGAVLAGTPIGGDGGGPKLFRVVRELVKHSADFRASFSADTENFAPFEAGSLIAEDGQVLYRTGGQTEYVVFPNPDVRPGLRAGLMVVPV